MSSKKILYIDMDDVLCDYQSASLLYKSEQPKLNFPQSIKGFFENLKPVEGAIESVNKLRTSSDFDIYVLTAPSTRNVHSYSEKRLWIEKYFDYDFTKRLIICGNKGLMRGDFLIDDNTNGKGQEKFEGKLIHFGGSRHQNWGDVLQYLMEQVSQGEKL